MARPRGNQQMTEARRQSILVSAFNVFAKSGFRGGSLKQVAELEGISEAGILHHFKSKGQLLIAVLESNKGIVELFCILSAEATAEDHPAHEYFKERYKFVTELTAKHFELLHKEGKLREGIEPDSAASALVAVSDGLQVQWLLDPSWDMLEGHRAFFRGILRPEFEHLVSAKDARDYTLAAGGR